MTQVHEEDGGVWTFDARRELYFRELNGVRNAMIFGKYLPNPIEIRQESGRTATAATKALWEHWNAYNNA